LEYIVRAKNPTTAWVSRASNLNLESIGGNTEQANAEFHIATSAGATEPNLSTALTTDESLYNTIISPYWWAAANGGVDWMMWYMTTITVQ
jgi:hypothetical protein